MSSKSNVQSKKDLPPKPDRQKVTDQVSPPLSHTRLHRLIYLLVSLSVLYGAFYSYRMVQHKNEVGGWWNFTLGKRPQGHSTGGGSGGKGPTKKTNPGEQVEDRINALAEALGMPSKELASAIAGAVREHVPPKSLSSVQASQTGTAVEALVSGAKETEEASVNGNANGEKEGKATGGVMDSFVGLDEP